MNRHRLSGAGKQTLLPVGFAVFCLHTLALAQTPSPLQPLPVVQKAEALAADTRLERRVSFDTMCVSLEDLCRQLSDANLHLEANRLAAPCKLQLRLKERPLHQVMSSIGQVFNGEWHLDEDKQGYTFYPNEEAKKYRNDWWTLFLGERDRAIQEQKALVLKKMREAPRVLGVEDPANEVPNPKSQEAENQKQDFFRALPASLQERIADQLIVNAFYGSDITSNFPKEGGVTVVLKDLPTAAQEAARTSAPTLQNNPDAVIHFSNFGYAVVPRIMAAENLWKTVTRPLSVGVSPTSSALLLDHKRLLQQVKRMGKDAPEAWKRLAAYQESRVWQNDLPALQGGEFPPHRRAEVLAWIAEKADLEFIADFHSTPHRALLVPERKLPLPRPLKAELDYQAAVQDMRWKQNENGLYLFRNNRWYRDDALEVPASLLRRWEQSPHEALAGKRMTVRTPREEVLAQIKLELETQAQMVETLSIWQIANGLMYYVDEKVCPRYDPINGREKRQPFAPMAVCLLSHLNTVRFYASLSAAQREALLAGRLELSSLTSAQRQQAFFLVPEMSGYVQQNPMGKPLLDIACEILVTTILPPHSGYFGPGGLYQYHPVLVRSGNTGQ